MKRLLGLGSVLCLCLICGGCGDTFRPIIIPNTPTFPNPAAAHTVVSINDNAPPPGQPESAVGTAMVIDVTGDIDTSIANVGLAPVFAVQQTANVVLVANHSIAGALADSVTKLNFSSTSIFSTNTISLPANSAPNFLATTESSQAYVLLSGLPAVGVLNTLSNSLVATVAVGNDPDAMAETANGQKLYVANLGDNTVSGFNTATGALSSRGDVIGSFNAPLWISARSDSQRLYVLNGNGVISTVDTTSSAGPDIVIDASITVPAGAAFMFYDVNKNRLYIPGGTTLTILDVSQSVPALLATIPIPAFSVLNLPAVPATTTAVAALPDGTRAYVGSYAVLPSQFNVTAVAGDGTTADYAYTLTAGHDLNPGVTVTVTGTTTLTSIGFDGTYIVSDIVSGTTSCPGRCFEPANTATTPGDASVNTPTGPGTGSNVFPQVTVVDVSSNTIKTTVAIPGFPDATDPSTPLYYVPVCATTRFRFMMAAAGDSTRAYLSSCDGGNVNLVDTSIDDYILNLAAPIGIRPPISPNPQNPPQNPVFLIAGP